MAQKNFRRPEGGIDRPIRIQEGNPGSVDAGDSREVSPNEHFAISACDGVQSTVNLDISDRNQRTRTLLVKNANSIGAVTNNNGKGAVWSWSRTINDGN